MKKIFFTLLCVLTFMLIFGCSSNTGDNSNSNSSNTGDSGTTQTITFTVDEQVKVCFDLTNEFRTGSEAWYWNKDDSTKTNLVGKLSALTLDEDLCKAAQVRANEIVKSFSHTRPNGESCFTVLGDLNISYSAVGENIAAGRQTGSGTFNQWKEDDEQYSGQGHRRNMLSSNFTKIGIAYTYDVNSTYKYYWVMILAK